jgi:hypothetical protein
MRHGAHTDRAVWGFWALLAPLFAWAFLLFRRERKLAWLCWLVALVVVCLVCS